MTREKEFANFVAAEAKRRHLSYFLLVGNDDTNQFSYRTEIATTNLVLAETMQILKDLFTAAGCTSDL